MPSIHELAKNWRDAQHVEKVMGGKSAAAAAEAARKALADAAKKGNRK